MSFMLNKMQNPFCVPVFQRRDVKNAGSFFSNLFFKSYVKTTEDPFLSTTYFFVCVYLFFWVMLKTDDPFL